ncbi:hypothetical protein BGW36DRAFT_299556 [Talaromyces proteolyticus]|uniref:Protein kinase domain-containing protein n=1 Tax=Talaromyces proteolyticus TaxID=1131652 RepID=A0AAD4KQ45_9EURO|nr:uncharacterized protein BGW36DRAFT_299556 [Talaromyces proteolyticus]KAH8695678.1 hypothetical protein BGW36DRAFT_299556 [Talaromyces proteolyticus]
MIVVRQSESPWDTFTKIYDCDLAGPLAVVAHRARPSQLFGVRTIRHKDIDQLLHLFESLQHPNVLSALEAYVYDKSLYIFHSDICISLDEIITCDADLDEIQLAAILAQILDGLLYLTERNTQHPCLSSQNILCTSEGEVKIARLEECKEVQADKIGQYSKELEVITMELMQVYKKGGSNAELDNTERWDGSDALEFLLSVVSEAPIQKLREHPLFTNNQWLKGHLQGLVSYASRFAFTFCDYADA